MTRNTFLSSGSFIAALLASSCCALPFLLFSIGVSGAWVGTLRVFEPFANIFLGIAITLVAIGFYLSRRARSEACKADGICATPRATRFSNVLLYVSLLLILLSVFWPTIVKQFFGSS